MARRKAPEPVEEIEEIEELDDLEELDDDGDAEVEDDDDLAELEDEEEEPEPVAKPVKKAAAKKTTTAKAAAPKVQTSGNDSNWLAGVVTKHTGKEVDSRQIRVLLRKLAKTGKLAREVGVDRNRYDFPLGVKDPIVVQVVKLVKAGALEQDTTDRLAAARAAKEAKKAAAVEAETPAPVKKAAPAAAPVRKRAAAPAAKAAPVKRTRATTNA